MGAFKRLSSPKRNKPLRKATQQKRKRVLELLEPRHLLAGGSLFPGNDCPPELDLSAIGAIQTEAGQPLTIDLQAMGATTRDVDASGNPTGDVLRFELDPDIGTDTPDGATITDDGIITWTPTSEQTGVFDLYVILIDAGTPPLADVESLRVNVGANNPPEVDLNGAVAGTGFTANFTEGDAAVSLASPTATIVDPDSTQLSQLTFTFDSLPDGALETLTFTTTGTNITGTKASNVLTFAGTDSVNNYQSVLKSLQYLNTSDDPTIGTRSFTVVATDSGSQASTSVTGQVIVEAVDDAPVLTGSVAQVTFTEGDGPANLFSDIAITDVDGGQITDAIVSFEPGTFEPAHDTLVFDAQTGITGIYNSTTGVLAFTGNATLAEYQTLLRSVRFQNLSDNPSTGPRSVSVTVSSQSLTSNQLTVPIAVQATNDAALLTATLTNLSFTENGAALDLFPDVAITDVDGTTLSGATVAIGSFVTGQDTLTFTAQSGITGAFNTTTGQLVFTGVAPLATYQTLLRSVRYQNASDDVSEVDRVITLAINDGTSDSSVSRTLAVVAVNDAPDLAVIANDSIIVGQTFEVTVTATDAEQGQTLTFHLDDSSPSAATITKTSPTTAVVRWTPAEQATNIPIRAIVIDNGVPALADVEQFFVTVGANLAPQVTGLTLQQQTTVGDAAFAILPAIVLADSDSVNLTQAKLTITGAASAELGQLAATTVTGITSSFVGGVLTLSGTASLADYQQVLRTVTYQAASQSIAGTRTITLEINDGVNPTAENITVDIAVEPSSLENTIDFESIPAQDPPQTSFSIGTGQSTALFSGAASIQEPVDATNPPARSGTHTWVTTSTANVEFTGVDASEVSFFVRRATVPISNQGPATISAFDETGAVIKSVTIPATAVGYQLVSFSGRIASIRVQPNPSQPVYIDDFGFTTKDIPPVIDLNGAVLTGLNAVTTHTVGNGATALLASGFTVTDVDSTITNVKINATRLDGDSEVINAVVTGTTITAAVAGDELTLTGPASPRDFQQVLSTLSYNNTAVTPTLGDRVITFVANDGTSDSETAILTLTVQDNTAPQQILSTPNSTIEVAPGEELTLPVTYTTSPLDDTLTGYGFRAYFDSSKLTFNSGTTTQLNFLGAFAASPDTANEDADPETDSYVSLTWVDISGNWPGEAVLPATLASLKFQASATFDDSTSISLVPTSIAAGYKSAPSTVLVERTGDPLTSPGAGIEPEVDDAQISSMETESGTASLFTTALDSAATPKASATSNNFTLYLDFDGTTTPKYPWPNGSTPPTNSFYDIFSDEAPNEGWHAFENVKDIRNSDPANPELGDRYIVGISPSGAWTGKPNRVATYVDNSRQGEWQFDSPLDGQTAKVGDHIYIANVVKNSQGKVTSRSWQLNDSVSPTKPTFLNRDSNPTIDRRDALRWKSHIELIVRSKLSSFNISVKSIGDGMEVFNKTEDRDDRNAFVIFVNGDRDQRPGLLGRTSQARYGENNEYFGHVYAGNVARLMNRGFGATDTSFGMNVANSILHEFGHMMGLGHPYHSPLDPTSKLTSATVTSNSYDKHHSIMASGFKPADSRFVHYTYPNVVLKSAPSDAGTQCVASSSCQNPRTELIDSVQNQHTKYATPSRSFKNHDEEPSEEDLEPDFGRQNQEIGPVLFGDASSFAVAGIASALNSGIDDFIVDSAGQIVQSLDLPGEALPAVSTVLATSLGLSSEVTALLPDLLHAASSTPDMASLRAALEAADFEIDHWTDDDTLNSLIQTGGPADFLRVGKVFYLSDLLGKAAVTNSGLDTGFLKQLGLTGDFSLSADALVRFTFGVDTEGFYFVAGNFFTGSVDASIESQLNLDPLTASASANGRIDVSIDLNAINSNNRIRLTELVDRFSEVVDTSWSGGLVADYGFSIQVSPSFAPIEIGGVWYWDIENGTFSMDEQHSGIPEDSLSDAFGYLATDLLAGLADGIVDASGDLSSIPILGDDIIEPVLDSLKGQVASDYEDRISFNNLFEENGITIITSITANDLIEYALNDLPLPDDLWTIRVDSQEDPSTFVASSFESLKLGGNDYPLKGSLDVDIEGGITMTVGLDKQGFFVVEGEIATAGIAGNGELGFDIEAAPLSASATATVTMDTGARLKFDNGNSTPDERIYLSGAGSFSASMLTLGIDDTSLSQPLVVPIEINLSIEDVLSDFTASGSVVFDLNDPTNPTTTFDEDAFEDSLIDALVRPIETAAKEISTVIEKIPLIGADLSYPFAMDLSEFINSGKQAAAVRTKGLSVEGILRGDALSGVAIEIGFDQTASDHSFTFPVTFERSIGPASIEVSSSQALGIVPTYGFEFGIGFDFENGPYLTGGSLDVGLDFQGTIDAVISVNNIGSITSSISTTDYSGIKFGSAMGDRNQRYYLFSDDDDGVSSFADLLEDSSFESTFSGKLGFKGELEIEPDNILEGGAGEFLGEIVSKVAGSVLKWTALVESKDSKGVPLDFFKNGWLDGFQYDIKRGNELDAILSLFQGDDALLVMGQYVGELLAPYNPIPQSIRDMLTFELPLIQQNLLDIIGVPSVAQYIINPNGAPPEHGRSAEEDSYLNVNYDILSADSILNLLTGKTVDLISVDVKESFSKNLADIPLAQNVPLFSFLGVVNVVGGLTLKADAGFDFYGGFGIDTEGFYVKADEPSQGDNSPGAGLGPTNFQLFAQLGIGVNVDVAITALKLARLIGTPSIKGTVGLEAVDRDFFETASSTAKIRPEEILDLDTYDLNLYLDLILELEAIVGIIDAGPDFTVNQKFEFDPISLWKLEGQSLSGLEEKFQQIRDWIERNGKQYACVGAVVTGDPFLTAACAVDLGGQLADIAKDPLKYGREVGGKLANEAKQLRDNAINEVKNVAKAADKAATDFDKNVIQPLLDATGISSIVDYFDIGGFGSWNPVNPNDYQKHKITAEGTGQILVNWVPNDVFAPNWTATEVTDPTDLSVLNSNGAVITVDVVTDGGDQYLVIDTPDFRTNETTATKTNWRRQTKNRQDSVLQRGSYSYQISGKGAVDIKELTIRGTEFSDRIIVSPNVNIPVKLYGFGGDDVLIGGDGADTIEGGSGNDTLSGRGGNDLLRGGADNDVMQGGTGNDYLYGDAGIDSLFGDEESDHLYGGTENDNLSGGFGNDFLYGEGGADVLDGDEDSDMLYGGSGKDIISGGSGIDYLFGDWIGEQVNIGLGEDDFISGGADGDFIFGHGGNDVIDGDDGNDVIYAHAGNDIVMGGDGEDLIFGGKGDDRLFGDLDGEVAGYELNEDKTRKTDSNGDSIPKMRGADTIHGDAGHDFITGGGGDDWLYGDAGADLIQGNYGNDYIFGGGGPTKAVAMSGPIDLDSVETEGDANDLLLGGFGSDHIYGGKSGPDLAIFPQGNSKYVDLISGDAGTDYLYGGSGPDVIDAGFGDNEELYGGSGDDHLDGFYGTAKIHGGADNDTLIGSFNKDTFATAELWGDAGNDIFIGSPYNDHMWGGLDNDTMFGAGGDDVIYGGLGRDTLYGDTTVYDPENGNDVLYGGPDELSGKDVGLVKDDDANVLHGGGGNDVLTAGGKGDELYGGIGDDILFGGAGSDRLFGNEGDDQLAGAGGDDFLYGGPDRDLLWGDGAGFTLAALFNSGFQTDLKSDVEKRIAPKLVSGAFVPAQTDPTDGDDVLYGDSDVIGGPAMASTIATALQLGEPTMSSDWLFGGGGSDFLYGQLDGDYLDGGAGNDELHGEEGNDVVRGGSGSDWLYGETGIDVLRGDDDSDYLFGGEGNGTDQKGQSLYGGEGNDYLYAFAPTSSLETEKAKPGDALFGEGGNDFLFGNIRQEHFDGGLGEDTLYGDYLIGPLTDSAHNASAFHVVARKYISADPHIFGANDTLIGGPGNDKLYGGGGDDKLWGGLGRDDLEGQNGNDELYGGSDVDTLYVDSNPSYFGASVEAFDGHGGNVELGDSLDNATDVLLLRGTNLEDKIYVSQGSQSNEIVFNFNRANAGVVRAKWIDNGVPLIEQFEISSGGGNDQIVFAQANNEILKSVLSVDDFAKIKDLKPVDFSTLVARTGFQTVLSGGSGNDLIIGTDAKDQIDGGSGSDTLYGFGQDDRLYGDYDRNGTRSQVDRLYAGQGNDDLIGGIGTNYMFAWSVDPGIPYGIYVPADAIASIPVSERGMLFNDSGDANGDGLLDSDTARPARKLESTGINRMLGGTEADFLYAGTNADFLHGGSAPEGKRDSLHDRQGILLDNRDNGLVAGDEWKDYAKQIESVWYVAASGSDDVITVDLVTEPGILQNRHLVTRLTRIGDDFTFDAQIALDFKDAKGQNGLPVWQQEPTEAFTDRIESGSDGTSTSNKIPLSTLLPPERDYQVILIDALGGDDQITVGPTVTKTVWIDAGDGDDRVEILAGNPILIDRSEERSLNEIVHYRNDEPESAYSINDAAFDHAVTLTDPTNQLSSSIKLTGLTLDSPADVDYYQLIPGTTLATSTVGELVVLSNPSLSLEILSAETEEPVAPSTQVVAGTAYLIRVTSPFRTPGRYDLSLGASPLIEFSLAPEIKDGTRKDVLLGGNGNDVLIGGPGADWIFGGPGNDVLLGGEDSQEADLLFGEAGDDTFQLIPQREPIDPLTGNPFNPNLFDQFRGGSGTQDRVVFVGAVNPVTNKGTPDAIDLAYSLSSQGFYVSAQIWDATSMKFKRESWNQELRNYVQDSASPYSRLSTQFSVSDVESFEIETGEGDDTINIMISANDLTSTKSIPLISIASGDGNDRIFDGDNSSYINAGPGNDFISGAGGNDVLFGGDGEDYIVGNSVEIPVDQFEFARDSNRSNNTSQGAFALGAIEGDILIPTASFHSGDNVDWYTFSVPQLRGLNRYISRESMQAIEVDENGHQLGALPRELGFKLFRSNDSQFIQQPTDTDALSENHFFSIIKPSFDDFSGFYSVRLRDSSLSLNLTPTQIGLPSVQPPNDLFSPYADWTSIGDLNADGFDDWYSDRGLAFGLRSGDFRIVEHSPDFPGVEAFSSGDLDGDGAVDLVIAVDLGAGVDVGIIFGGDRTLWNETLFDPYPSRFDSRIIGDSRNSWYFGDSAISIGDINGDAFDDLLITNVDDANQNGVIFGGSRSLWASEIPISELDLTIPELPIVRTGPFFGYRFVTNKFGNDLGKSLWGTTPVGDLNGDDLPEFLSFLEDGRYGDPTSILTYGKPWSIGDPFPYVGPLPSLSLPNDARYIGDINGDLLPDFAFTSQRTIDSINGDAELSESLVNIVYGKSDHSQLSAGFVSPDIAIISNGVPVLVKDLDGDGADEIAIDEQNENGVYRSFFSLFSGIGEEAVQHANLAEYPIASAIHYTFVDPLIHGDTEVRQPNLLGPAEKSKLVSVQNVGDVSGDGIDDTLFAYSTASYLAFGPLSPVAGVSVDHYSHVIFRNEDWGVPAEGSADFNRDGIADLVFVAEDNTTGLYSIKSLISDASSTDFPNWIKSRQVPSSFATTIPTSVYVASSDSPSFLLFNHDGDGTDDLFLMNRYGTSEIVSGVSIASGQPHSISLGSIDWDAKQKAFRDDLVSAGLDEFIGSGYIRMGDISNGTKLADFNFGKGIRTNGSGVNDLRISLVRKDSNGSILSNVVTERDLDSIPFSTFSDLRALFSDVNGFYLSPHGEHLHLSLQSHLYRDNFDYEWTVEAINQSRALVDMGFRDVTYSETGGGLIGDLVFVDANLHASREADSFTSGRDGIAIVDPTAFKVSNFIPFGDYVSGQYVPSEHELTASIGRLYVYEPSKHLAGTLWDHLSSTDFLTLPGLSGSRSLDDINGDEVAEKLLQRDLLVETFPQFEAGRYQFPQPLIDYMTDLIDGSWSGGAAKIIFTNSDKEILIQEYPDASELFSQLEIVTADADLDGHPDLIISATSVPTFSDELTGRGGSTYVISNASEISASKISLSGDHRYNTTVKKIVFSELTAEDSLAVVLNSDIDLTGDGNPDLLFSAAGFDYLEDDVAYRDRGALFFVASAAGDTNTRPWSGVSPGSIETLGFGSDQNPQLTGTLGPSETRWFSFALERVGDPSDAINASGRPRIDASVTMSPLFSSDLNGLLVPSGNAVLSDDGNIEDVYGALFELFGYPLDSLKDAAISVSIASTEDFSGTLSIELIGRDAVTSTTSTTGVLHKLSPIDLAQHQGGKLVVSSEYLRAGLASMLERGYTDLSIRYSLTGTTQSYSLESTLKVSFASAGLSYQLFDSFGRPVLQGWGNNSLSGLTSGNYFLQVTNSQAETLDYKVTVIESMSRASSTILVTDNDRIFGGAGVDRIVGGPGIDYIEGGVEGDYITAAEIEVRDLGDNDLLLDTDNSLLTTKPESQDPIVDASSLGSELFTAILHSLNHSKSSSINVLRESDLFLITSLDLSGSSFSDLSVIADRLPNIERLNLSRTQVSGFGHLNRILSLREVWLEKTVLEDTEVRTLISHPSILRLNLSGATLFGSKTSGPVQQTALKMLWLPTDFHYLIDSLVGSESLQYVASQPSFSTAAENLVPDAWGTHYVDEGETITLSMMLDPGVTEDLDLLVSTVSGDLSAFDLKTTQVLLSPGGAASSFDIQVLGVNDDVVKSSRSVFRIREAEGLVPDAFFSVEVRDDDRTFIVDANLFVSNEGAFDSIPFRLTSRPDGPVAIMAHTDEEATIEFTELTIEPKDWEKKHQLYFTTEEEDGYGIQTIPVTITGAGYQDQRVVIEVIGENRHIIATPDIPADAQDLGGERTISLGEGEISNVLFTLGAPIDAPLTLFFDGAERSSVHFPASVTFTTEDYQSGIVIPIEIVDDNRIGSTAASIRYFAEGWIGGVLNLTLVDDEVKLVTEAVSVLEGDTVRVPVSLGGIPNAPVTVVATLQSGSESRLRIDGMRPLVFTAENWNIPQFVTVRASVLDGSESEYEWVDFTADWPEGEGAVFVSSAVAILDESRQFSANFSQLSVPEGGSASVVVTPHASVGQEYTLVVDVKWASGSESRQMITVPNDSVAPIEIVVSSAEDADSFSDAGTLTISAADFAPLSIDLLQSENDRILEVERASLSIAESGAGDAVRFRLAGDPRGSIIVSGSQLNGTLPVLNGVVPFVFDSTNWNEWQEILLSAGSDADALDSSATVQLASDGWTPATMTITQLDQDRAVRLNALSAVVASGIDGSVEVRLQGRPDAVVKVKVTLSDLVGFNLVGADSTGAITLSFSPNSWNIPSVVQVRKVEGSSATSVELKAEPLTLGWTSASVVLAGELPSLDVDGDGEIRVQVDGILVTRYIAGLRGDVLTANLDLSSSVRSSAVEIEQYIAKLASFELDGEIGAGILDVSGDGKIDVLTDGILLQRWMVRLENDSLVSGFPSSFLKRSATEMTTLLNRFQPATAQASVLASSESGFQSDEVVAGNIETADSVVDVGAAVVPLSQADIQEVLNVAIDDWLAIEPTAAKRLAATQIQFADLNQGTLAWANSWSNTIVMDINGDDSGWFIDPTPEDSVEFAADDLGQLIANDAGAVGHHDLYSVLAHELGHILGHGHEEEDPLSVMQGNLPVGQRRLVTPPPSTVAGDSSGELLASAVEAAFGDWEEPEDPLELITADLADLEK